MGLRARARARAKARARATARGEERGIAIGVAIRAQWCEWTLPRVRVRFKVRVRNGWSG